MFPWYLDFCPKLLFGQVKKRLDKKAKVNFKIYDASILPNFSRKKDNQAMKFGHLKEYNMTNIFFEKSYAKCQKLVSDTFVKNQNWAYLWINSLKCFTVFLLYVKQRCWPLALILCLWPYVNLSKNKNRSETRLSASSSVWFLKKNISHIVFY